MLRLFFCATAIHVALGLSNGAQAETARGVVYVDANGNNVFDSGERGIEDVAVSNGLDVTLTDGHGRWELDCSEGDILFVVKPRNYQVSRDENNIPRFYYVHQPSGTPAELGLRFGGVLPSGPLPASIDFGLVRADEDERFDVVLFADTQPQGHSELDYLRDDVISEIVGIDAAFGITLGDILYDDLSLFPRYLEMIGEVGIPWYHVPGNHELNWQSPNDEFSLETYKRFVGPTEYSFDVGKAHFVVLDDVVYGGTTKGLPGASPRGKGPYRGGFTERQLDWLENDLEVVPNDRLVILTMHIAFRSALDTEDPATNVHDRKRLFDILSTRRHVMAFAGHSHTVEHHYFGEDEGFRGADPLHQHVLATACGSWWSGPRDERGIPFAIQRDGTPNGYTILEVDGTQAVAKYRAAGKASNHQMRIGFDHAFHQLNGTLLRDTLDGELWRGPVRGIETGAASAFVNVFDAGPRSSVFMSVDGGAEVEMQREFRHDPSILELEQRYPETYKSWALAVPSTHLWVAPLPTDLSIGAHTIGVRAVDEYGQEHRGLQVFEVQD